jgi:hypothetical protein
VVDTMSVGSCIVGCSMIVETFCVSETYRSTLNHISIDRSDRDLSKDDKISREKSG